MDGWNKNIEIARQKFLIGMCNVTTVTWEKIRIDIFEPDLGGHTQEAIIHTVIVSVTICSKKIWRFGLQFVYHAKNKFKVKIKHSTVIHLQDSFGSQS